METANPAEGSPPGNSVQNEEFTDKMLISFNLKDQSDIVLELYNLKGEKCGTISLKNLHAGDHQLDIHTFIAGITKGRYVYYLQVSSIGESFTECRSVNI